MNNREQERMLVRREIDPASSRRFLKQGTLVSATMVDKHVSIVS